MTTATDKLEKVQECIDRNIVEGMIMTIGRDTSKYVEIVSTTRVGLTKNSITVKDRGDRYCYYISVDSLYFDNGYICPECTGAGCKVCYDPISKTFTRKTDGTIAMPSVGQLANAKFI